MGAQAWIAPLWRAGIVDNPAGILLEPGLQYWEWGVRGEKALPHSLPPEFERALSGAHVSWQAGVRIWNVSAVTPAQGKSARIQKLSLSITSVGVFEAPVEKTLGYFLTNFTYNYTFLMVLWDPVSGRPISESVGETCWAVPSITGSWLCLDGHVHKRHKHFFLNGCMPLLLALKRAHTVPH